MSPPAPAGRIALAPACSWFHPLQQRPHHLADALAAHDEVIYVELGGPHPTPREVRSRTGEVIALFHLSRAGLSDRFRGRIELAQRALWKTRALTRPLGLHRWFDTSLAPALERRSLESALIERLAAPGPRFSAILLQYPWEGSPLLLARMRARGVVTAFDLLDDFTTLGGAAFPPGTEAELIRHADVVVATTAPLLERARDLGRQALLLPNAVDVRLFGAARVPQPRPADWPEDWPFPPSGPPLLLYSGAMFDWFDHTGLAALAAARRDLRFLLVGLASETVRSALAPQPNVRFLAARPIAELIPLLSAAAATIVPFRSLPLTAATSPLKVYESLAAGKPVLASGLPEIAAFPGVYCTHSIAHSSPLLDRVLAAAPDLGAIDRFVAEHTWTRRAADLRAALSAAAGRS